jgi:HSP20 family protein
VGPFWGRMPVKDREKRSEDESRVSWYPAADIYDTKDNYVLKIEVPGLSKKDVNIEVEDNILSVKGERKEEKDEKKDGYRRTERHSGVFYRAFRLPRNVDAGKIGASLKDGILELKVAKPEEIKPKNIPISIN